MNNLRFLQNCVDHQFNRFYMKFTWYIQQQKISLAGSSRYNTQYPSSAWLELRRNLDILAELGSGLEGSGIFELGLAATLFSICTLYISLSPLIQIFCTWIIPLCVFYCNVEKGNCFLTFLWTLEKHPGTTNTNQKRSLNLDLLRSQI